MSPMGEKADRVCTECGRSPVAMAARTEAGDGLVARLPAPMMVSERRGKRSKRRSKKGLIAKVFFGWLLFMGLILLIGRLIWPASPQNLAPSAALQNKSEMDDRQMVEASLPDVAQAFQDFISASTPEEKAQYVHDPIRMAGRLSRYYQYGTSSSGDLTSFRCTGAAVIHLPEGDAIEARWEHDDGRIYQAFFRKEAGEWRLDWEDFVRYSEEPWAAFLQGSSDAEGEFRLLARERGSRGQSSPDSMNLVFYTSRPGFPDEVGAASPQFVVKRDSEDGKLLQQAFAMREKGRTLFDSSLPDLMPAGMIRIRAKIRRVAGSPEPTFILEKILACHWLDTNASGLPKGSSDGTDKR